MSTVSTSDEPREARERAALAEPRAHGVSRILVSEEELQQMIRTIARELDEEYRDETPLMVGVLTGAISFMADLMKAMTIPVNIDFMAISSYGAATKSSGVVRILKDLNAEITDRRLIIVEDIVDTGLTLHYLQEILRARNPKSLRTACLLSKPSRRKIEVQVDYIGFTIEDKFVVGYGLDSAERFRHLPFIGEYQG